jgi:cobalt-precorrin 5A hydrolase
VADRKAVIAAGFGCRAGCSAADLLAALERALAAAERSRDEVAALYAPDAKCAEPGLRAAAAQLGKPLVALAGDALKQAGATLTVSQRALRHFGVGSVAEAAALAGAAQLHAGSARLLGPRCITGAATCALAIGAAASPA